MTSTDSTSNPITDRAMTRSEERLVVGTARRITGRARLQKFVTTETVTIEVLVRREEVRLVHEPASDADLGVDVAEPAGGRLVDPSPQEHVLVLHEERPVVTMEVVPVERVRMVVDTVTASETVSGQVREEHIELEHDAVRATPVD